MYDIYRAEDQPLRAIFAPKTVAVIGASNRPDTVGHTLLRNLINHPFGGTVFPVNPRHSSVMGIQAYPNLAAVPQPIDLAVIATPAATVPEIVRECVAADVKGAVIVSAGFREAGSAGMQLEQQILTEARRGRLRIIGPNCLGVMNPLGGLNATFASGMARPGNVGFISQSGALCSSILDWSLTEHVGFSAFISIGSMLDVGWGDLIDYLGDDPHTQSILLYMESVGDARSFISAAREVALSKPIIVIKAGQTEVAARASASHTGALTGRDEVLDAAFRRCGVLRVMQISELFNMAQVLAKQPRPKGPRLIIITNAGGPGILATDFLVACGGELAELSTATLDALHQFLPAHWSHANPIDILGDATPERYARSLEVAAKDPNGDGVLVILTPQAMTEPTQTAEQLKRELETREVRPIAKPILASWMGGGNVRVGEGILNHARIPTYAYPDAAVRAFSHMWQYSYNLQGIYETPTLLEGWDGSVNRALVRQIIDTARQAKRQILTEAESKQILEAYGIPTVKTCAATNEIAAVECANALGYPVVVKLLSETIAHKTDVGSVHLNLANAAAVQNAYRAIAAAVGETLGPDHFAGVTVQPMIKLDGSYELIVGSSIDPQFGPILLFGLGGHLVEVMRDRAIALPPLNTTLARRMLEQTQIYSALKGLYGKPPIDLAALEQLLVRFSQLVVEQPWLQEIDINPLLASAIGANAHQPLLALDAHMVLHEPETTEADLPQPVIRPYPVQYVELWTMKDGATVTIRPIRPEDEPMAVQFHRSLSEQSVYLRYFHFLKLSQRIAHKQLMRLCFIDYDREMVLVADYKNPESGTHEILAVGRLSQLHGVKEAEFSLMVSDRYQHLGLGTEILRRLVQVGRDQQLTRITGEILHENRAMRRVCEKVGFCLEVTPEWIRAEIRL
ncbi:MAG: bifunctional acetate--CoA ligase family protein/GNAT family N-acetyltransferase [Leptolyngbyaceae cyanobacterium]